MKAVRVFVNNAPDQWHVTTGKWGAPSVAVCDSEETAVLFAAAPAMLEALENIDANLTGRDCMLERIESSLKYARAAIAQARGAK